MLLIQPADQFSYDVASESPCTWLSLLLYMSKVPYSHLGLASGYTCLGVSSFCTFSSTKFRVNALDWVTATSFSIHYSLFIPLIKVFLYYIAITVHIKLRGTSIIQQVANSTTCLHSYYIDT